MGIAVAFGPGEAVERFGGAGTVVRSRSDDVARVVGRGVAARVVGRGVGVATGDAGATAVRMAVGTGLGVAAGRAGVATSGGAGLDAAVGWFVAVGDGAGVGVSVTVVVAVGVASRAAGMLPCCRHERRMRCSPARVWL